MNSARRQVLGDDLRAASIDIKEALIMRQQYCRRMGHYFPVTTTKFLTGEYPSNLPPPRQKVQSGRLSLLAGCSSNRFT